MTSEAKVAANRRNARRSTGPRTRAGKMRVRRNALRHGLAAVILRDSGVTAEVERVALAMCGSDADPLEREQALVVAEAQITLKQIRRTRAQIVERLSQSPPSRRRDARAEIPPWLADPDAPSLDQLSRLERYERHAFSRRKQALRLASLRGSSEPSAGEARGSARCNLT
jgi:hypothetical protein